MQHRLHSPFPAATCKPTPKCQRQRCCLWLWRPRAARCIQCCRQEVALKKTKHPPPQTPQRNSSKPKPQKNNKIILCAKTFFKGSNAFRTCTHYSPCTAWAFKHTEGLKKTQNTTTLHLYSFLRRKLIFELSLQQQSGYPQSLFHWLSLKYFLCWA